MKNTALLLSFLVLICFSCEEEVDHLPDEKIVQIMTDLLMADEFIVKYGDNNAEYYKEYFKKRILKIHGINESVLDSLIVETQKDLKYYHTIQKKIEEHLTELQ